MTEEKVKLIKLTRSPKDANRFYAEFDNGDAFSVTVTHIADFGLFTGAEIELERYRELSISAERSKVRARAMRILGTRPMSSGELVEKLTQKGEREVVAVEAAQWLCDMGALNDEEYASMVVRHYAQKGYGTAKIKNELYRRKIPKDMWDTALEAMPESDDTLERLIRNKLKGDSFDRKEIKKVSDMLLRRGFSYDEIRSALRAYTDGLED